MLTYRRTCVKYSFFTIIYVCIYTYSTHDVSSCNTRLRISVAKIHIQENLGTSIINHMAITHVIPGGRKAGIIE